MITLLLTVFSLLVTGLLIILAWDMILLVLTVLVLIPAPYFMYCLVKGMYEEITKPEEDQ